MEGRTDGGRTDDVRTTSPVGHEIFVLARHHFILFCGRSSKRVVSSSGCRKSCMHPRRLSWCSLVVRKGFVDQSRSETTKTMRLLSSTTVACAAASGSLLGRWPVAVAWSPAARPMQGLFDSRQSLLSPSVSRFASTLTSDEQISDNISDGEKGADRSPSSAVGQPIAEATIVSCYRGGLAVLQIQDEVTWINGDKAMSNQGDELLGHEVVLPSGTIGVIVAYRPPIAFVYSPDGDEASMDGVAKVLSSVAKISVTDETHLVDGFGRSLEDLVVKMDHASDGGNLMERPIYAPIPQIKDIALINSPMLTGTTMVDALAPIGKGQNMLVIGHDQSTMRGFVRDFLSTQVRLNKAKCVLAITKDQETVMEQLRQADLLDDVIIVSSQCDEKADLATKAAEATLVAATACSIAETLALTKGKETLVIVDSIDQHKELWAATTQTLIHVFGADAVVQADREGGASSEMRAFYSSLIQRAAQFKSKKGGGSVTLTLLTTIPSNKDAEDTTFSESDFEQSGDKIKARVKLLINKKIPLTPQNLRKIDIPIPSASEGQRRLALQHVDDLISMSDGQIWLDERLADAGQSPPMDPQKSITRVGIGADTASRADAPALRRIVEGIRLEIAQAASMDGAEATEASRRQIRRRNAWLLAMHQQPGQGGRSLSESCVALLAACTGALDETVDAGGLAGTKQGQDFVQSLLEHVKSSLPSAMKEIDETLDLSPETRSVTVDAIESFSPLLASSA
jgi:F0F1-type ATP synthase alpha subunit